MAQNPDDDASGTSPSDESFTHLTSFRVGNMVARPRAGRAGSRAGLPGVAQNNSARNSLDQPAQAVASSGSSPSDYSPLDTKAGTDSARNSISEAKSSPRISIDDPAAKRPSQSQKSASSQLQTIDRFSDAFWKGWLRKKRVGTMGIKRRFVVVKPHRIEYYKDPNDTDPCGTIEFNNIGLGFDDKFTVISTRGIFEFQTEDADDHEKWTRVFVRVLSSINK
eukprot:TRINITY_DN10939_c0_g1_i1.p1 TRINITY_DN10939_c0_g1~~TRINITY_DN10939_c0_g1_i1.p1  ORF type:complete len:222 (+),score=32.15 TRINITY_DN10939_c0_g1_i1:181-846(+)